MDYGAYTKIPNRFSCALKKNASISDLARFGLWTQTDPKLKEQEAIAINLISKKFINIRSSNKSKITLPGFFSFITYGLSDCWYWGGDIGRGGYGLFNRQLAHRVSWKLFNKEVPDGLFVLHRCDVRPCVNPDHLFIGTQKDNALDCVKKGRWVGINGHKKKYYRRSLSESQLHRLIFLKTKLNFPNTTLSKIFNISLGTTSKLIKEKTWKL